MGFTGDETTGIATWLYGLLSGDATLQGFVGVPPAARVYDDHSAQGVPVVAGVPILTFRPQLFHPDTRIVAGYRIVSRITYLVKAIGQTASFVELSPIASRVDFLLQGASGTGGGFAILSCVRERGFTLAEVADGKEYRHLGGFYTVVAQPA